MDRRTLLKLLLSTAIAEAVDVEQLLWVPKPIVMVAALPMTGTVGAISRSSYAWWRNASQYLNGEEPLYILRDEAAAAL